MKIARVLLAISLTTAVHGAFAARADVMEGNPASQVKVLIYEDLQSGDCARFRELLDQKILPRYGSRVAFIYRDFPLGRDDWALPAAIAARWVYERDPKLGIVFRRELLAEQDHIRPANLKDWLIDFAARNDLNQKGILDSLNDRRLAALVDQDWQGGVARGISKAPTACIGGQVFAGIILYDDLARALDEALAR